MNLFKDLEGQKGENLASAGLRVLVLRSLIIRSAIIKLLSDNSPIGPLVSESHFSCYTEHSTDDVEYGQGRLDLVVELDGAILGIESKFFASFTKNQPIKYKKSLELLAESLTKGRGTHQEYCLFVLAPENRKQEIINKLKDQSLMNFISWESIISTIKATIPDCDEFTAQLARDYTSFVSSNLEFMPDFKRKLPHLMSHFYPKGSELQYEFLSSLSNLWATNPKLNRGPYWCGYYLTKGDDGMNDCWVGFMPRERIVEGGTGSIFILASKRDYDLKRDIFSRIQPTNSVHLPKTPTTYLLASFHWEIKLSEDWNKLADVSKIFAPIIS